MKVSAGECTVPMEHVRTPLTCPVWRIHASSHGVGGKTRPMDARRFSNLVKKTLGI